MGWKSTIDLDRQKAIMLINARLLNATNQELGNAMEALGYGENTDLPYYGHNFYITDEDNLTMPPAFKCR